MGTSRPFLSGSHRGQSPVPHHIFLATLKHLPLQMPGQESWELAEGLTSSVRALAQGIRLRRRPSRVLAPAV